MRHELQYTQTVDALLAEIVGCPAVLLMEHGRQHIAYIGLLSAGRMYMGHSVFQHPLKSFGLDDFTFEVGLALSSGQIASEELVQLISQFGKVGTATLEDDATQLLACHRQQQMFHSEALIAARTHLHHGKRYGLHQRTTHHRQILLLLFHGTAQRETGLIGASSHLSHAELGYLLGVHPADAATLLMHGEHDGFRFF